MELIEILDLGYWYNVYILGAFDCCEIVGLQRF